jgi:hypothetical protein
MLPHGAEIACNSSACPGIGRADCQFWEVGSPEGELLFFQQLGALSGHLITEEGDLGYSEDALHWVDEDSSLLKSVEEGP